MSIFRIRHITRGGHTHCSLFVSPRQGATFAKCGDFTVSAGAEFEALRSIFHAEYIDHDKAEAAAKRAEYRHAAERQLAQGGPSVSADDIAAAMRWGDAENEALDREALKDES